MPKKKSFEEWKSELREVHGDRLEFLRFSDRKSSAGKSYIACRCPKHGEFEAQAPSLRVSGCASCWAERRGGLTRLPQAVWLERFKAKHGDRYVYSSVTYEGKVATVNYFCEEHGDIKQNAQFHASRGGCPSCGFSARGSTHRLSEAEWFRRFKDVHGGRYHYLEVVYRGTDSARVKYVCPIHGETIQNAKNHSLGSGCSACASTRAGEAQTLSLSQWAERFTKVHGSKYNYLDIVRDSATYVLYECPDHGQRLQVCSDHARGFGCPECTSCGSHGNKHTDEISEYLSTLSLNTLKEHRVSSSRKRWDVAVPEVKLAVEFDGVYYHSEKFKSDRSYMRTKASEAELNGYRQINIWEDEWHNKKAIVKRLLASACGKSAEPTIYARKTSIAELEKIEVQKFLDENHIQGFVAGSNYLGLKSGGSLVACMVYSYKSAGRSTKKVEDCIDIQRYATSCHVVGGFQKLLKRALLDEKVKTVISYSDPRLFTGGMYEKAGFVASPEGGPDYCYVKSSKRIPKRSRQKSWFKGREGVLYDPTLTEYELALLNGYQRLWFRGKVKWVWVRPQVSASRHQPDTAPMASS